MSEIRISFNDQTVCDALNMSKSEFASFYERYHGLKSNQSNVLWNGLRENYTGYKKGLRKSLTIDETEYSKEVKEILENNKQYKQNSDKIKALFEFGLKEEEIFKVMDDRVSLSYVQITIKLFKKNLGI